MSGTTLQHLPAALAWLKDMAIEAYADESPAAVHLDNAWGAVASAIRVLQDQPHDYSPNPHQKPRPEVGVHPDCWICRESYWSALHPTK